MKSKKYYRKIIILPLFLLLISCASTPTFQEQISQFQPKAGQQMLIVRVPDTGSAISNGMLIAAMEAGTASNASQQITEILTIDHASIAVAGSTQNVHIATIKRALKDFSGQSNATIYIQADEAQLTTLRAIAKDKGITIKTNNK